MLYLTINDNELFDNSKNEFILVKGQTIKLEHSLISISKWESKWCKPFLSSTKNYEETIDYVRCMTISSNVDPMLYFCLTPKDIETVNAYIANPMSATTFTDRVGGRRTNRNGEIVTSELIYYWMTISNIPPEYEKWHLNRLMNLIKICDIKSQPPKNMRKGDILRQNAALNTARRAKYNSKG